MGLIRFGKRMPNIIRKITQPNKKHGSSTASFAHIFAGEWQFTDENNSRVHHLHIQVDMSISLGGRALPGSVLNLNERELVFLDSYGYHLRIDAIDGHPISVYDEADDRVYQLSSCNSDHK